MPSGARPRCAFPIVQTERDASYRAEIAKPSLGRQTRRLESFINGFRHFR